MKLSRTSSLLAIGLMVVVASLSILPVQASEDRRLITVTGDAEVRVVPDEVVITVGIETSDEDIEKAKQKNDERVQKVLELTDQYGIEAKTRPDRVHQH